MSVKRDWFGVGQPPRVSFCHRTVDGVHTGSGYRVHISTVIGDERGPEAGRRIVEWLTSEEARKRAQEMIKMADTADRRNAEM